MQVAEPDDIRWVYYPVGCGFPCLESTVSARRYRNMRGYDSVSAFITMLRKALGKSPAYYWRNQGVIVNPVSNPSGLSRRVTFCPQGSVRFATSRR